MASKFARDFTEELGNAMLNQPLSTPYVTGYNNAIDGQSHCPYGVKINRDMWEMGYADAKGDMENDASS